MPSRKVTSPPGVKTRARRSSVYRKAGVQLSSPPSSRTRRRSMYVSGKPGLPAMAEFSKVWATPAKQPDPVATKSPEKVSQSPVRSRARKTPKVEKPVSPKLNTPDIPVLAKTIKSPSDKKLKTPAKSKAKTPAKSIKMSAEKAQTPASVKSQPTPKGKTPKSAAKPSAKKPRPAPSGPASTPQKTPAKSVVTSTPSKTLKDITGKSFYSTPSETPIPVQRSDEVFVFSAQPAKSAKKSAKKSSVKRATIMSPKITPHKKSMKTPKKTPLRKTPAPKKRSREDSSSATPSAKRAKTSLDKKTGGSTKESARKLPSQSKTSEPKAKLVLTPTQMTSILKDVEETEREEERRASLSPPERPRKLAKLAGEAALSTPRVKKVAKRASPKKLAEIHHHQSSRAESDKPWTSMVSGNESLLDETINTDSRSGRCVIL